MAVERLRHAREVPVPGVPSGSGFGGWSPRERPSGSGERQGRPGFERLNPPVRAPARGLRHGAWREPGKGVPPMRFLARFGLGLCGLSLVAASRGAGPGPCVRRYAGRPAGRGAGGRASPQGIVRLSRHCVECQRAYVKTHDGVDVPLRLRPCPPGGGLRGQVAVHQHVPAAATAAARPARPARSSSGRSRTSTRPCPGPCGRRRPGAAGQYAPGHAVVGGAIRGCRAWIRPRSAWLVRLAGPWAGPHGGGRRPGQQPLRSGGPADQQIPPQTAIDNASTGRPHVISHLFGLGGITRTSRRPARTRQKQQHASIAYDPPSQPVNELPASWSTSKGR